MVSWVGVPDYQTETPQTFQIRLYPEGRIEFAFSGVSVARGRGDFVGGTARNHTVVSFANDTSGEYYRRRSPSGSAAAKRSTSSTTAQKFYQTHDDAYDYLVIYNNWPSGVSVSSPARPPSATIEPDTETCRSIGHSSARPAARRQC